jgi:hypothetical protein
MMPNLPHDVTDLRLAPVLLALEDRITELGGLDVEELNHRVALDSDRPGRTAQTRRSMLLTSLARDIDCHGWVLSWDPRGLRVTHAQHSVVLGVPAVFDGYIAG